jgi:uncharacterized membrane protein (DUF4010 family)
MSSHPRHSISRTTAGLIAVVIVFGFAILMVVERYDPAVITTVVTGTSLAAAELVHRLQAPTPAPSEADRNVKERS